MRQLSQREIQAAMDLLRRGYEEERNLYTAARDLTLRQRRILQQEGDLLEFYELLDEKEDLLLIIGQMEKEMKCAKKAIVSLPADMCPGRWRLACLLERVTDLIEEMRVLEKENVGSLEALPV